MAEESVIRTGNDREARIVGKPRDLGLMPMVAEFLNDFIDPQGRMVYTVEKSYVACREVRDWDDVPTEFYSTIVGVFSTEAAARARMRKEMAEVFLTDKRLFGGGWGPPDGFTYDATWSDFYCGGGTSEEKEAAIQSLLDGQNGAESKFRFPWSEDARADMDNNRLLYACCGDLTKFSRDSENADFTDIDDDTDFYWLCENDWGDMLVIRALLVRSNDSVIDCKGSTGHEMPRSDRIKRRRTMLQISAEEEADGKGIDRSLDLGLVPMIASLVNDFIGPQGRMVYIVETGYVSNPSFRNWQDAPSEFQSTVIDVFSTQAAARACLRKEMANRILAARNVLIDHGRMHADDGTDATWGLHRHG